MPRKLTKARPRRLVPQSLGDVAGVVGTAIRWALDRSDVVGVASSLSSNNATHRPAVCVMVDLGASRTVCVWFEADCPAPEVRRALAEACR